MMAPARILAPATRKYQGGIVDPDRWSAWRPRFGDVLVTTPSKSGTTWAQTILTMLLHGGPDLPDKVPMLSPWLDADLGVPVEDVKIALEAQFGRRVIKTHTPADGFPVWDGVTVIAVYRHPLDVFFSLRKHIGNTQSVQASSPGLLPVSQSFLRYIHGESDPDRLAGDSLATLTMHYRETVSSGRLPNLKLFHYADMLRDGRHAVAELARAAAIDADASLIDQVAQATSFGAMKAKASEYAPVGGTGFWKSDAGFFDSASSQKWEGQISDEEFNLYKMKIEEQVPNDRARHWLENGDHVRRGCS